MVKKFSCSVLLLPVALVLHGGLTAFQTIMLRAGTGTIDSKTHQPSWHSWYAVLIETDQFMATVDREDKDDLHGLPDSHDFSKRKDFYAIYPSLYCSGTKNNGAYEYDYCSPWGSQFDLQWLWRVWGIDLVQNDYIGYRPKIIFYSLMTGACGTAFSLFGDFIGLFSYWSKVMACVTSWVSFFALIATSVTSQQFVSKLVNNAHTVQPTSGSGTISAEAGPVHTRLCWILAFTTLADSILLTFIVWQEHKRKADQRQHQHSGPGGGGGVFGSGGRFGGVYEFLVPGGKEGKHGGSRIELISRSVSREPSPAGRKIPVVAVGAVTERDSAYEPMRHRGV